MLQPKIRPRYQVEKLEGTVTRRIVKIETKKIKGTDKIAREFVYEQTEQPAGFMVYFPQGHSIRVSEEELKRLGLARDPQLVDMNTGEVFEDSPVVSLKELTQRMTKPARSGASAPLVHQ